MTWRERRTITILSIILAVLSAALLIVLGIKYRESREAEDGSAIQTSWDTAITDGEYTALTYYNGSATLSFALDEEGGWIWADDPDFPLDSANITAVLDTLANLVPQQVLSEPDTLESYGLDTPAATLTATTADQRALTLAFGKTTTDGDSYYTMMNGNETTIYIFADTLFNLLATPIYDMMDLPELPELTGTNLLSLSIRGADAEDGTPGMTTTLTAQRPEGEGTTWLCGGSNVTGSDTLQALLEDLADLTFTKCVDYHPSERAVSICGFDAPTVLTVIYQADTGVEQTLTLRIGSTLPEGSGRYVQMDEDTTIYFLPTSLLDPLMRVSVNGLEDT